MKKLLCTLAFAITAISAVFAYDLRVTVREKETGRKTMCLDLIASRPDLSSSVGEGKKDFTDSVYVFKNLPDEKLSIVYFAPDGSLWGEDVDGATDTLTMTVPRMRMPRQLGEVTVTADDRYIADDKTVFRPSRTEKKMANSGSMLITAMAIPSVMADAKTQTLRTAAGEAVATYIDFRPASADDVANLNTMDVERVEVYDFPKDPRFNGALHVVNFVMVKYEYGGYTKLSATQTAVTESGNYSASSKMAYKKMTYDLALGYRYSDIDHIGTNSTTDYTFADGIVNRTSEISKSHYLNHNGSATFRAVYQGSKSVISNTFTFSLQKTPDYLLRGNVDYNPRVYQPSEFDRDTENSSAGPAWQGSYYFALPKSYTLQISPKASYAKNTNHYRFASLNGDIFNNVSEKAWDYTLTANLKKQLGRQSVGVNIGGGGQGNNLVYGGTSPARMTERYYYAALGFMANLSFGKFWIQPNVHLSWNRNEINQQTNTEITPKYFIAAGWNINSKNRINISSEQSYWTIPMNLQGSNLQMTDEINAIRGNDRLKLFRYNSVNLNYEWMPLQKLSFSLYSGFWRQSNPIVSVYAPLADSATPVMVQSYENRGFINQFNYGGAASLRLFGNSLNLRAGLQGASTSYHGLINLSRNTVSFNGQAIYSYKQFYAIASYQSADRSLGLQNASRVPSFYYLQAGWGNGTINVSAAALNVFRSDWIGRTVDTIAHNYLSRSVALSESYHRKFQITLTYTFSYGKKVQPGQSPEAVQGASSGILK